MDPGRELALRRLLQAGELAALGTLHDDEPFVSMVAYALLPRDGSFVIHVSGLAAHTRHMLAHPAVSLLVLGERAPGMVAQAVPRVSVQGQARQCSANAPQYAPARQAYLARFPDTAGMFGFGDFSLFLIAPRAVRFVAGFAQAFSVTGERYAALMAA